MSLTRKIRRNQDKRSRKLITKAMKTMAKRIDSLDDKCANCGAPFDKQDTEQLDSWVVYRNHHGTNIICPTCKIEIEALKKQILEAEAQEGVEIA